MATGSTTAPSATAESATIAELTKLIETQAHTQQAFLEKMVRPEKCGANVKLPELKIPTYDGNILNFNEFWDIFKSTVDDNTRLSDVEKLSYLRNQLQGKALASIKGLPITNASYKVAVEKLKEQFGNVRESIDAHYTALMALQQCDSTTSSLRSFYDQTEMHMRSLEALSEDTNSAIFVTIIMGKLPSDVKLQLEMKQNGADWSVQQLRKSLCGLINAQEKANGPQEATTSSHKLLSTGQMLLAQTSTTKSYEVKCIYCGQTHYSDECSTYSTLEQRKPKLNGHCYICLKSSHMAKHCQSKKSCYYCKRFGHHSSLCPEKFQRSGSPSLDAKASSFQPKSTHTMVSSTESHRVMMQTAVTTAVGSNGDKHQVRILFDTGSSRSYINRELNNRLGLHTTDTDQIAVATFGSTKRVLGDFPVVHVNLHLQSGGIETVRTNVIDNITCPMHKFPLHNHPSLRKLPLAEPLCDKPEMMNIDILIGADQYYQFVTCERLEYPDGMILLESSLGFLMAGKVECSLSDDHTLLCNESCSLVSAASPKEFNLERFWNLECIGINDEEIHTEDDIALESFEKSVRFVNGRYFVSWPWKSEEQVLPENYMLAKGRLQSLLKRLPEDVLKVYDETIHNQIETGIVEMVDVSAEPQGTTHYIPHHCVVKPSSESTKLRIVYDASAKMNRSSSSLNDALYRGPVLLPDLCGILLRFRMSPVAISSDVEKAFLQIGLNQTDRDCTRFLWVKDTSAPALGDNVITLRFCRVPFGVIASPFLLSATVNHHLKQTHGDAQDAFRNIYVDNVVGGAGNTDEAKKYYDEQKQCFQDASMNLRQWCSNDKEFVKSLPDEDQVQNALTKILGVAWDTNSDTIGIQAPKERGEIKTKRDLLQWVSSVFDPLGLLSPVTLEAKILMQTLWKIKHDWDDVLPTDIQQECKRIQVSLSKISELEIPRHVGGNKSLEDVRYELHVFTDASASAYGAAAYLRAIAGDKISTNLIFSKSRVAPTKPTSIPRLELFGMVLGAKLVKFIRREISVELDQTFIWTDSKCALAWVTKPDKRPQFIARRVKLIKEVENVKFGHVQGVDNPADIVSRGATSEELSRLKLWWKGPTWLKSDVLPSITELEPETVDDSDTSLGKESGEPHLLVNVHPEPNVIPERYSSFLRLVKVNAWVTRFISIVKKAPSGRGGVLSSQEIQDSRLAVLKQCQESEFRMEHTAIETGKYNDRVNALGLFLDSGIIRCKGRLEYSDLPYESKYPVLLPTNSYITELIVVDQHRNLKHAGSCQTLAELRKQYWIPKGKSTVKRIVKKCMRCRRFEGSPFKLPCAPPLPKERVTANRAFESIGLDYFGPMYVKGERENQKVWVCLYTCLTSRAVHLELVNDMGAEEFIMAFRRFISRRGTPRFIVSDNAKQFKLSKNVLDLAWCEMNSSEDVMQFVMDKGIKWKFITELAPWMGGVYERMVGLVKNALRKSIGVSQLTHTQLTTLLMEVEAVVNSRPLLALGEEFNLQCILTPAHLLTGNVSVSQPVLLPTEDPDYFRCRNNAQPLIELWQRQHKSLNQFWKVWSTEYLLSLRERDRPNRIGKRQLTPTVGHIVLIKDDLPRSCWKLGKITALHRSSDGETRSASLQLPSGRNINRSVSHLYPLECAVENESESASTDRPPTTRQRRNAAAIANIRNADLADDGRV